MSWKDAVRDAVDRICDRNGSDFFTRQELIERELPRIIQETGSRGRTPEMTLSRELQELRDEDRIQFLDNRGSSRRL